MSQFLSLAFKRREITINRGTHVFEDVWKLVDTTCNQVSYDPRSYERNLCNCECRSLKNSTLQRGSNLNFSGFYIRNCINCIHNCEGHSLLGFTSAVQCMKDFIYNFTLRVTWKSCISLRRKLANAGGRIFSKIFFSCGIYTTYN